MIAFPRHLGAGEIFLQNPIDKVGISRYNTTNLIGRNKGVQDMTYYFTRLLRANFRFGRM